jgi:hypothetical protein
MGIDLGGVLPAVLNLQWKSIQESSAASFLISIEKTGR